jgi:UDP-N-acetylmuramoylalanine-D-glutamate ligase
LTAALELASAVAARQPETEIVVLSDGRVNLPDRLALTGRVRYLPVGRSGDNQAISTLSLGQSWLNCLVLMWTAALTTAFLNAGPTTALLFPVAAGCGLALGLDMRDIVEGLEAAPQVPGRLERIDCTTDFSVFVDYAHTPDGLEKAISAVRDVTRGRVITVFGCGGDRDPEKRPLMGAAAGLLSDVVVVTSDNPRSEDPVGIILHIEDGLRPVRDDYLVEVDRHRAIERAVAMAEPGDAVLVAGKGHEDYQIFAERTIHFDDREVVREVLSC